LPKARSRKATGEWRIVSLAIVSAFVASCTATGDPTFDLANPAYNGASAGADVGDMPTDGSVALSSEETTTDLPETVAFVPAVKPGDVPAVKPGDVAAVKPSDVFPEAPAPAAAAATTETVSATTNSSDPTPQAAQAAASDAQAQSAAAAGDPPKPEPRPETKTATQTVPADYPVQMTATDPNQPAPQAYAPKKKGFFASLFGTNEATAAPAPLINPQPSPKPVVTLASAGPEKAEVKTASLSSDDSMSELDALPGVRQSALFEIKRKSGLDDDSDVDLHEDEDYGPVQVATAGGLARLAPNGLIRQTDNVDVACLKPSLVRVLKTVENHYGRKLIVTSGYRSPAHNRRARGAKNSLHMYCAAADIQVPGISKWELAQYFRSMPGRGGVGTYCHTASVHIDVGPERDWNWRCRRRKA
jgi:uncharacterized protein YcbK (DUF882 family)